MSFQSLRMSSLSFRPLRFRVQQSGAHQPRNRLRGLADLSGRGVTTLGNSLGHAVAQVLIQQAQCHRLQRPGRGRDLSQDVDAVLVLLDHPLQAADLPLDPAQPLEVVLFVLAVSVHPDLQPPQPISSLYYTPARYMRREVVGNLRKAAAEMTNVPDSPLPGRDRYPTRHEGRRYASWVAGRGSRSRRSRRAFTATMKLEPDIARAAISGRSTSPSAGSNTPAAIGSAIEL